MNLRLPIANCRLKWALAALILFFAFRFSPSAFATDLSVSNNASISWFSDSYDSEDDSVHSNNITGFQGEAYVHSYFVLMNPATNVSFYNFSRSGGLMSDETVNASVLGIVTWGFQSNHNQHIGIAEATENGSLTSNQMFLAMSNLFLVPGTTTNGTANTNEPGWCQNDHVQWIGMGNIPTATSDGGPTVHGAQNDGGTNAGWTFGVRGVDLWHITLNAWTNDWVQNGGANVGWIFKPAPHPGKGGQLNRAFAFIKGITSDFDVSTCTLDWGRAAESATNHCVISSISKSGNTLTFNRLDDRLPFAWDMPDGTITNNCSGAFNLTPGDGNLFHFTLQITNLPVGYYNVFIDGVQVRTNMTASELSNGWNMFTNYCGPYWNQRVEVLGRIRDFEYVNRVTLKPGSAGDGKGVVSLISTVFSRYDTGLRGDGLINDSTVSNKVYQVLVTETNSAAAIHAAAQPTNHTFAVTLVAPRFAPFHR